MPKLIITEGAGGFDFGEIEDIDDGETLGLIIDGDFVTVLVEDDGTVFITQEP